MRIDWGTLAVIMVKRRQLDGMLEWYVQYLFDSPGTINRHIAPYCGETLMIEDHIEMLQFFHLHKLTQPLTGTQGYNTASGGLTWPRYTSIYTGVKLYNYAVSGAVCSNQITPRTYASINASFPDIAGYELPACMYSFIHLHALNLYL
jgi:hypothetical protein